MIITAKKMRWGGRQGGNQMDEKRVTRGWRQTETGGRGEGGGEWGTEGWMGR